MNTIWKFELETIDFQQIQMLEGYQILTIQVQNDKPYIWAMVDTERKLVIENIIIHGTGEDIEEEINILDYLGTYQLNNGRLVFHVFREI